MIQDCNRSSRGGHPEIPDCLQSATSVEMHTNINIYLRVIEIVKGEKNRRTKKTEG